MEMLHSTNTKGANPKFTCIHSNVYFFLFSFNWIAIIITRDSEIRYLCCQHFGVSLKLVVMGKRVHFRRFFSLCFPSTACEMQLDKKVTVLAATIDASFNSFAKRMSELPVDFLSHVNRMPPCIPFFMFCFIKMMYFSKVISHIFFLYLVQSLD